MSLRDYKNPQNALACVIEAANHRRDQWLNVAKGEPINTEEMDESSVKEASGMVEMYNEAIATASAHFNGMEEPQSCFAHQDAIDYAFAYHKLADTLTFTSKANRAIILDETERGVLENKTLNQNTAKAYLAAINFLREADNSTAVSIRRQVNVTKQAY